MKWITAADKFPMKVTDDLSKDKGIIFVNKKRTAIMYVFLSITPNIPALLQNDLKGWQWLDESTSGEGEAIGFAEWLGNEVLEYDGKGSWTTPDLEKTPEGNYKIVYKNLLATRELFNLYKQSKK